MSFWNFLSIGFWTTSVVLAFHSSIRRKSTQSQSTNPRDRRAVGESRREKRREFIASLPEGNTPIEYEGDEVANAQKHWLNSDLKKKKRD